jgi:hypothetical protein
MFCLINSEILVCEVKITYKPAPLLKQMQWKEKQLERKALWILNVNTGASKLSYLCSGQFTPEEIVPATHWLAGWMSYILMQMQ